MQSRKEIKKQEAEVKDEHLKKNVYLQIRIQSNLKIKFFDLAKLYNLTPSQILRAFIATLVQSSSGDLKKVVEASRGAR